MPREITSATTAPVEDQHTPTPWELEYDEDQGRFTLRMDEAITSRGFYNSAHLIELYDGAWEEDSPGFYAESKANSERIVAAVNACEGISTAALESGYLAEMVRFVQHTRRYVEQGYAVWLPGENGEDSSDLTPEFHWIMATAMELLESLRTGAPLSGSVSPCLRGDSESEAPR